MTTLTRPGGLRAALCLLIASGFAGLGYQIVWTQQSALWLGHEAAGVLAVVTAFFGGLAFGSLLFGPHIERSTQPARCYAACEFTIALWSLLLSVAMAPFSGWLLDMTGPQPGPMRQWVVAFCGTFLLLLPATAAMGATLPAMQRLLADGSVGSRWVAALYASNTCGAVIGVLVIALWLIPQLGLRSATAVCIVLNVLCGVTALCLFERKPAGATPAAAAAASRRVAARAPQPTPGFWHQVDAAPETLPSGVAESGRVSVLVCLVVTGLLGIGYEVLVVRVLSQVTEDTVYTFAMLLAVYLAGTSLGAAAYQRWLSGRCDPRRLEGHLLLALSMACLAGTANLWAAESLKTKALATLGATLPAALAAEALLAVAAFGLPTLVMGAVFSHLSARAIASGTNFGYALGVNTLGAAVAPVVFGVLAFPTLGAKDALLLVCLAYAALTLRHTWRGPAVWAAMAVILAVFVWAPRLAFIDVPPGGHIVSYQEGVLASVSVVEDVDGVARLRIDNRQQEGSSASLRVDARQAWLPVMLHPAPRSALFLGLGTGVTAASAAHNPHLRVDAVELLPEVIGASNHFIQLVQDGVENPRLHLMSADARRYVRTSERRYDVIVSDNFHPARSGSGTLYTVEHFSAVRQRLAGGGLFCQWLPLHQMDLQTLRHIVRSFQRVYPHSWAILASNSLETPVLGLVGREDDAYLDLQGLRRHLNDEAEKDIASALGIEDELALLGVFVAGPESLAQFAADAQPNTDDHPVVAYRAPRITYAPDSAPRERLTALLAQLRLDPAELLGPAVTPEWSRRLAGYWRARERFIESGQAVQPATDVRSMLAQVREPLLTVLRISPDFRPAYDPLLGMAVKLGRTDVLEAVALLQELARLQPQRREAVQALRALGAAP